MANDYTLKEKGIIRADATKIYPSVDAMYGPWASVAAFRTYLGEILGGTVTDDIIPNSVEIGIIQSDGTVKRYEWQKPTNGQGSWVSRSDSGGAVASVNGKTGVVVLTKSDIALGNVDNTSDVNKPISTATQTALNAKANVSDLTAHTGSTSNPHGVTKAQVGLGNVDNTADADKIVKRATEDGSGNAIISTYQTKTDAASAHSNIQGQLTTLSSTVANLTGLDGTNFGGFSIQQSDSLAVAGITTLFGQMGYTAGDNHWFLAGTSMASLKAYRFNGVQSDPVLISSNVYDFTDFSGLQTKVDKFKGTTNDIDSLNSGSDIGIYFYIGASKMGLVSVAYDATHSVVTQHWLSDMTPDSVDPAVLNEGPAILMRTYKNSAWSAWQNPIGELAADVAAFGSKIDKIISNVVEYGINNSLESIYSGKQLKVPNSAIGSSLSSLTKVDGSNFRNVRVPLAGFDRVEFLQYTTSTDYGSCFVDANDNVVGVVYSLNSSTANVKKLVPEGAVYLIWSYNITISSTYCRCIIESTFTIPFEKVIDKNSGQTVNEKITEIGYKDVVTLHKAQVNALSPYITDKQLKASGVIGTNISSVATTSTTGYNIYKIPILQGVKRITFPVYNSSYGYGSLITDESGIVLQEFTNNVAAGGYNTGTLINVDVAEGAAFFYFNVRPSWYDENTTDFSLVQHVALKDIVDDAKQEAAAKLGAIVNDAPKAANLIIAGNRVKLSADTIDDVAWENLTYRDIFETNNILGITAGFESGSYSPLVVGAGSPSITTEDKDTGTYSLKAFGTSSCQLKHNHNIYGTYFMACRIKCSRYVQGYAGVVFGSGTNGAYVTAVTNGFVTASGFGSRNQNSVADLFVGTWSSASIDCYIDTPVVVNTNIFAASPTAAELTTMYETYLSRKFGNASVELLFVTEPADKEDGVCKNAFVNKMNEYASQFGMSNTYFANASGLSSASYTTTKDFIKLVACCTANEKVMRYWGQTSYSVVVGGDNARTISGSSTYKGTSDSIAAIEGEYHIFGGKSGTYTPSSHTYQNLALCVKSKVDDRWICACIIDNSNSGLYGRFAPMKTLLDWLEEKRQNPSASTPTIAASAAAAGLLPLGNPVSCADLDYTIVSKNGTTQYVPASMTKLMTAILVCEYAKMDEVLTIKASDIQSGSGDTYYAGDTISIGDAVLAMLLPSSNTLATALSRFVGNKILKIKSA